MRKVKRGIKNAEWRWLVEPSNHEIGVFSHMSCEVGLFYDHSGVKPTFWVFTRVLSITKVGVVGYLLSWIVDKLSICVLYYILIYSSVILSWAVE